MSFHDRLALEALAAQFRYPADAVLLDLCRLHAAARITGASRPLDDAMALARDVLPTDRACLLFGATHDLVARMTSAVATARHGHQVRWYPASCRMPSRDEAGVLRLLRLACAGQQAAAVRETALWIGCAEQAAALAPTLALLGGLFETSPEGLDPVVVAPFAEAAAA